MSFSIASNFGDMPEWHQVMLGLAAVAGAISTVSASDRPSLTKKDLQLA
ncbi:hypothetical protein ACFWYW_33550 [Nonomuraea sp. NPDC059023]